MTTTERLEISDYFNAIDRTWPAAEYRYLGQTTCRKGNGAGMRVSAISMGADWTPEDIEQATIVAQGWHQPAIFMIKPEQSRLDQYLCSKGFEKCFETLILSTSSSRLATFTDMDDTEVYSDVLLQSQRDIWSSGGHVEKARWDVMERVTARKSFLLGRLDNRPLGTGFVASHDNIAMLHALEVHADAKRRGLGSRLSIMAAKWAAWHDAEHFSLLVTRDNSIARALYDALGMEIVGGYHYRVAH